MKIYMSVLFIRDSSIIENIYYFYFFWTLFLENLLFICILWESFSKKTIKADSLWGFSFKKKEKNRIMKNSMNIIKKFQKPKATIHYHSLIRDNNFPNKNENIHYFNVFVANFHFVRIFSNEINPKLIRFFLRLFLLKEKKTLMKIIRNRKTRISLIRNYNFPNIEFLFCLNGVCF